ncbi:MAG TPA: HD domain-containing protein [bacterium]|nr:HD domain-containing protein [bacterium]
MVRKRTLITEMDEGDIIIPDSNCYFLVKKSNVKVGKNGQRYMDVELFDGVGSVNGKVWDLDHDVEEALQSGNVIKILNGKVTKYQSVTQVVINDAGIVPPDKIDSECKGILPESKFSVEELDERWKDISSFLNETHKKLLDGFEKSGKIWDLYTTIPAGRSMHHACRRGLWEHSLNVAEIAAYIAEQYEERYNIDKSLIILASLMHDIGKVFEFQLNPVTAMVERYSDRGKLLGHIYMGTTWIEKLVSTVLPDDVDLKVELLHIMLSHHGEYEFGSPKKPKTMEALIVSMCDNLDANLDAIKIGLDSEMEGNWTKSIYMLQRAFYKKGTGNDIDLESKNVGND